MIYANPSFVTRYTVENIFKVGFPCSCHCSPFESESYRAYYTVRDKNEHPQVVSRITLTCSNCGQSESYDVADRYFTEFDINKL